LATNLVIFYEKSTPSDKKNLKKDISRCFGEHNSKKTTEFLLSPTCFFNFAKK
jgi:hypothetical protein